MKDLIGQTLGHYVIVEHLGGGGMGVVYKAEDTRLGRTVALKFLPSEWSRDPDARERFLREARAASALEDSRACTIFDIDETDDGQLFIAMAYYEGESLKKRLERGQLSIGRAVDIAIQTAEGLESAHSAEIFHRDIKPANLMLTGHDEVVIVDFGLAKLAGDLTLTKPGSSLGTPLYMSPEQSRGDRIDRRTDLWSLGVVLHEMLTGRPPFVGENHAAVARAILDDEPAPMSDLRPEAPGELGEIVARALAKDPNSRYQSAGELLTDLRHLRKQIAEVEDVTLSTPSQPSLRRKPRLPVFLAVGVVIIGVIAALWIARSTGVQEEVDRLPPRIVVLPFENLGPPEDEYFADGITEEITSRLAAVSGLQVISRTSAMYYKDRQVPLRQIGEELDVEYALEGTIRWDRAGKGPGRVRITPQLIRVANDSHLWSDRYDRVLDEIFVVQSDISERVISELEVALFDHERNHVTALPTTNVEAYQAYLLGNRYIQTHEEGGWRDSIDMLESSVELDPEFAVAHAALSRAHSMTYHYRLDFTPERLEKAKASADRALALQPDLPEAHLALGWYFYFGFREYDRALEEFERAAETLPKDEAVLEGLHATRRRQGRWDEALDALDQLLVLSPQSYHLALNAAYTHLMLRNYGRAEVEFRRALALEPDLAGPYHGLALLYVLWDESTERARQILELAPDQSRPMIQVFAFMLDRIDRDPESAMERVLGADIDVIEVQSYYWPAELLECVCLSDLGRDQPARAACESAISRLEREVALRSWDRRLYNALGYAYAVVGRNQDAVEAVEHAARLMPISEDAADGPEQAIETAIIFTRAGRHDRALDLVEELLSIPSFLSVGLLRLDPVWDPLRDHPRFQALLEEYGEE